MRFILLVLLIACHGTAPLLSQVVALRGDAEPRRLKTFEKTATGDWKTLVKEPDGTERPFVYVPSTKVVPHVQVSLALDLDGGSPLVTYTYAVANDASAKQELARLFIGAIQQVDVLSMPLNWMQYTPQHPGSVAFGGPLVGDVPSGIRPGHRLDGWAFRSAALPGVVRLRAMGNVSGAVTVPPGLTELQRQELYAVSAQATVDVPTVGPALSTGRGEPELSFDVLLSRVGGHFASELKVHRHPLADEVAVVFSRVRRSGASIADGDVKAAFTRLLQLAETPIPDPWHRQLSAALAIAVRALGSGRLPIKDPIL